MIKINLAKRKGAVASAGFDSGTSSSSSFGEFSGITEISRRFFSSSGDAGAGGLPIRRLAIALFVIAAGEFLFAQYQEDELAQINASIQKSHADRQQLQAKMDTARGYENLKKSIDADEQTIKGKIAVIEKLIADRNRPPKLLRAISGLIPSDVWLSGLKLGAEEVQFKGKGQNLIHVSDFLKSLEESADFTDVRLLSSGQAKDDGGAEATEFQISARRR